MNLEELPLYKRRVFISGPMTGIEHYNAPEFARAHAICREQKSRCVYDPSWAWLSEQGEEGPHEYYMRKCIAELVNNLYGFTGYDVLLQLPGWEDSDGCRLERNVAIACGIEVMTLEQVIEWSR